MRGILRVQLLVAMLLVAGLATLAAQHNASAAQGIPPGAGLQSVSSIEPATAPPDPQKAQSSVAQLNKRAYLPALFNNLAPALRKGIVVSEPSCQDVLAVGANWISEYAPEPLDCSSYGIESVPMIASAAMIDDIRNGSARLGGNSPYLMGFNEPDVTGMTPTQAAILWHDHIEPLSGGKKLGAPAVTQYQDCGENEGKINPATGRPYNRDDCPTPKGDWWLYQFRRDFVLRYGRVPRIDVLPVHGFHWWGELNPGEVAIWFENFISRRIALANEWGVPEVWITEFNVTPGQATYPPYPQCQGVGPGTPRTPETMGCYPALSQAQITSESGALIDWLKQQPSVTRYAWFASRQSGAEWWSCGNVGKPVPTPLCDRPLIVWGSPLTAPVLTADGEAYKLK